METLSLNAEYTKRRELSRTISVDMDFIVDEPVVVALIKVNGKVKAKGVAHCCPDDTFSEDRGANIACRRAIIDLCNQQLREWTK